MEVELKEIDKGPTLRTVRLDEIPNKGDEIHLDTYRNGGPCVEERYEITFFYRIFKSAENTRYIALVKML
jgi:hypothetical protein